MNIETRITMERVIPENRLIAPHWIATLGIYEGSGASPMQALESLLDKILAAAIKQAGL